MSSQKAAMPNALTARRRLAPDRLIKLVLILLALLAVFPSLSPLLQAPGTASGSFLSLGSEMLDGRVPYRDFWDYHAPLIFVVNAFGLMIGGNSAFGVWVLQFVSLTLAALMLYALLKRYFGWIAASFGSAALIANIGFVYASGNFPEAYGLPLQIAMLLLLSDMLTRPGSAWRPLGLGILLGLAMSLKLSLLATGMVALLFLTAAALAARAWRRLFDLLWVGAGAALVWAGWIVYFAFQHALVDIWDQVFRYSLFHSGVTNLERIAALQYVLVSLYQNAGFFAISLLSWLVVLPFLFFNESRFRRLATGRWMGAVLLLAGLLLAGNGLFDDRTGQLYARSALSGYRLALISAGLAFTALSMLFFTGWVRRWSHMLLGRFAPGAFSGLLLPLAFAFVDLPVQLGLASLSGSREFSSYLPVLPSMAVLLTFLAWSILQPGSRLDAQAKDARAIWLVVLSLPVLFTGWWAMAKPQSSFNQEQVQQAVLQVRQVSDPGAPILQWGLDSRLYFLADRPSASRYRTQQALFTPGYASAEKIQEFLADMQVAAPVLLIDTRPEDMPLVLPDAESCGLLNGDGYIEHSIRAERDARFPQKREDALPYAPPEMRSVYQWLCEHYELLPQAETDLDAWRFYRLRAAQP